MSEPSQNPTPDPRRKMAADAFNLVWQLLEKPDRSITDDDLMIHAAHASRYIWGEIGTAVNLVRGEWQVSRVYCVLNRPDSALYHARRCLTICEENNIGDFDIAYAYEGMARAAAIAGDAIAAKHYLELAKTAGEKIAEDDDKKLFFSDLSSVPGFSA